MSRSYREPYYGNSSGAAKWKTFADRAIRRSSDDMVDGALYKRMNEVWDSPMESKHGYWDVPKLRRK